MISHKHKCVFVHIPKVAGRSIEELFIEDLGLNFYTREVLLIRRNDYPEIGPRRLSHMIASEYVKYHYLSQELYDTYYKFAFVRDPYTRVYSFYKYFGYKYFMSFEKFVLEHLKNMYSKEYWFLRPQSDFLFDDNTNLLVDDVFYYEHIEEDYKKLCRKVNINADSLPYVNKSKKHNLIDRIQYRLRILKNYPKSFRNFSFFPKNKFEINEAMKEQVYNLYESDFVNFKYKR